MRDILKKYFGFDEFLPLQEEVVEHVLAKMDAVVLMPTGGGKSICFQLPSLIFPGVTLVISPLIALMKDQVDGLKANGVKAEFINSSLNYDEILQIQGRALQGEVKILYVAPERLALKEFRDFLDNLQLSLIAIDEAHCISEWGHDFRPDYRNLRTLKQDFEVPIVALTATATPEVREDILRQLNLSRAKIFISSFNRSNLKIRVLPKQQTFLKLLSIIENYSNESVIIYCFSRKDTEKLADKLKKEGYRALPYHAGLTDELRDETQDKFIRDEIDIVVATIAFGMGIDKSNVRLVVHYSFPKSLEGYYQEIGRAGRDGLDSECVLFYSYGDMRKHKFFVDQIEDEALKKQSLKKLNEVVEYCDLMSCRRKFILEYFGESEVKRDCRNCDICLAEGGSFDATEIAQKVLSCVVRLNSSFGVSHVIDVLKGKKNSKIEWRGHDRLSVFGIVDDFTRDQLQQIIRALISLGYLLRSDGSYPVLGLSEFGKNFLKARGQLQLPKLKVKKTKKRSLGKSKNEAKADSEAAFDKELFEKLRVLRKKIADDMGKPPFIVFGDVSLRQMVQNLPRDEDSFLNIQGVGEVKLKRFGEEFMELIKQHAQRA